MPGIIFFFFVLASACSGTAAWAAPGKSTFAEVNPDVGKYEFSRSYISALTYIKHVNDRWKKPISRKAATADVELMRGYVAFLIKDNADLRIAKNFLAKYLQAPNVLIRKVADSFILGCMNVIAINEKEKEIWDQWYAVKSHGRGSRTNETAFLNAQQELSFRRKNAYNAILESSVLLTKVMKSSRNATDKGRSLAFTSKERQKLLQLLDQVDKENMEWGLKQGQDHVTASIAVIREVLEDSVYTSQQ